VALCTSSLRWDLLAWARHPLAQNEDSPLERQLAQKARANLCQSCLGETSSLGREYQISPLFSLHNYVIISRSPHQHPTCSHQYTVHTNIK